MPVRSLPELDHDTEDRLLSALGDVIAKRPDLLPGISFPSSDLAKSGSRLVTNDFFSIWDPRLYSLAAMLISLGRERARQVIDALEGHPSAQAYREALREVAEFVAEASDLVHRQPPELSDVADLIVVRADSYHVANDEELLHSVSGLLSKYVGPDGYAALAVALGATAMTAVPHVEVVEASGRDVYRLAVDVYGRRVWLANPLTAVRLASDYFWRFGPLADELLDRLAEGVQRVVSSRTWAASVSVRRGPLVRVVSVRTTLQRFLGEQLPLPDTDLDITITLDAKDLHLYHVASIESRGSWSGGPAEATSAGGNLDVPGGHVVPTPPATRSISRIVRYVAARAGWELEGPLRLHVKVRATRALLDAVGRARGMSEGH